MLLFFILKERGFRDSQKNGTHWMRGRVWDLWTCRQCFEFGRRDQSQGESGQARAATAAWNRFVPSLMNHSALYSSEDENEGLRAENAKLRDKNAEHVKSQAELRVQIAHFRSLLASKTGESLLNFCNFWNILVQQMKWQSHKQASRIKASESSPGQQLANGRLSRPWVDQPTKVYQSDAFLMGKLQLTRTGTSVYKLHTCM